jgi:FkbM family methyltransferase
MHSRFEWYTTAARNLGVPALLRRQIEKRFGEQQEPMCLTSKYLKHPVYVRRGTSDLYVFDQILVDRQYSCLDHLRSPSLIIDCGANVGYSSAYFLSRFPMSAVLAVEPDASNFDMLSKNLAAYGNRCRPIRAAVWPTKGSVRTVQPAGNLDEWGVRVEPCDAGDPHALATVTIPDLLDLALYPRISILKIDIEGAEEALFQGDTRWLDVVDNIVIELHGDRCEAAFMRAIEARGFTISRSGELTVCLDAPN